MNKNGILIFATEYAKKNYKQKKKVKKVTCPSCELKLAKPTNFISGVISNDILKN